MRAVRTKLIDHIVRNLDRDISIRELAAVAGYSERHCCRIFRHYTGKPVGEYIRLLKLTDAARQVAQKRNTILHVAPEHRYDSHEGFTRAFSSTSGISPTLYRKGRHPIPYLIPFPVNPDQKSGTGGPQMKINKICTMTFVSPPDRKIMFLPPKSATDYFSFCEEKGCDRHGLLAIIPAGLDAIALMKLHPAIVPPGYSNCAGGVELPVDYFGSIPEGYLTANVAACDMLYVQGPPYKNEDDFGIAIEAVFQVCEQYDLSIYGYAYANDLAPHAQLRRKRRDRRQNCFSRQKNLTVPFKADCSRLLFFICTPDQNRIARAVFHFDTIDWRAVLQPTLQFFTRSPVSNLHRLQGFGIGCN